MELAFHKSGSGKPLVILHGLYGSSGNWMSIGKKLSQYFTVYLPDQRNHGHSPHHPVHTYETLREDLYEFFRIHRIENAILMGHSMGGKTAMSFALQYGSKIDKLIVVDIAPVDYRNTSQQVIHEKIISTLQLTDPTVIHNRNEADQMMQASIPQYGIRQFLLKNLKRNDNGRYEWILNIDAIAGNMEHIAAGILPESSQEVYRTDVPALFIKGEKSRYIDRDSEAVIHRVFTHSRIVTIPGAGHWVHAEQPALFLQAVCEFLEC